MCHPAACLEKLREIDDLRNNEIMRLIWVIAILICGAFGGSGAFAADEPQLSLELSASPPFELSFHSIESMRAQTSDPAKGSLAGFRLSGQFKSKNGESLYVKYKAGKSMRTRKLEAQMTSEAAPFKLEVEAEKYPITLEFFTSRNALSTKSSSAIVLVNTKAAQAPCPGNPQPVFAHVEELKSNTKGEIVGVFAIRSRESKIDFVCDPKTPAVVKAMLEIQGSLSRPQWTLLNDRGEKLPLVPTEGELGFRFELPIEQDESIFELMSVGPKGEISRSKFKVKIEDLESFERARSGKGRKPFSWSFGLGLSLIQYEQGSSIRLSQKSLTLKATADYALSSRWSVSGNVFSNLFALSSSMDPISARFLGANVRANFDPKFVKAPSRLLLGGGVFLSSMSVPNNQFGFKTFISAQIYPSYSYVRKDGSVIGTYVKLVPISPSFFTVSFLSREIAFGASYTTKKFKSGRYSLSLDYSNLLIRSQGLTRTYLQTVTVGLGMAF